MFSFPVVIDEVMERVNVRITVFLHSLKRHKINCNQAEFIFFLYFTAVVKDPSKQYI